MSLDTDEAIIGTESNETTSRNSSRSARKPKGRGKWSRSNETIGIYNIDEANQIAASLTQDPLIDLRLPTWSEICRDWQKCYWMNSDDVVLKKVVCLLCDKSIFEPAFNAHMKAVHPSEDIDTNRLTLHFNEVRLSRFYSTSAINKNEISDKFSTLDTNLIESFLSDIGMILDTDPPPLPDVKQKRGDQVKRLNYEPNFAQLDEVDKIHGIPYDDAVCMAEVMYSDYHVHMGILFTSEVARGGMKYHYCYTCKQLVPRLRLRGHLKTTYHKLFDSSMKPVAPILERLTDLQLLKYCQANPIPIWKINEICLEDSTMIEPFIEFLTYHGYIISKNQTESEFRPWPAESLDFPQCSPLQSESDDSASVSSLSVHSFSSNASSSVSSTGLRAPAPYSVMNHIRYDTRVNNVLLEIEAELEVDPDFHICQTLYVFVLGWASYNLVVSNGCKLSILTSLTDKDMDNIKMIEDTEPLGIITYQGYQTSTGETFSTTAIIDRNTYRALKFYKLIRDKVLEQREGKAHSFFFISYFAKKLVGNDADYPIRQFLRMCNIEWKFRSGHLVSAVSELVRYQERTSAEHSLDFYKKLSQCCKRQKEVLGSPELHPLLKSLTVFIRKKIRPDRGIKRPTVSDEKPMKRRRSRKITRTANKESSSDEYSDNETMSVNDWNKVVETSLRTPERISHAQACAVTPPRLTEDDLCFIEHSLAASDMSKYIMPTNVVPRFPVMPDELEFVDL